LGLFHEAMRVNVCNRDKQHDDQKAVNYFKVPMLKHIHLLFVALLVVSFVGRVVIAEFRPAALSQKWLRIVPHVLDTLLLLSGIALVFQGNWLAADYGWIVAKILVLSVFIGFGMLAMRKVGKVRLLAFAGALICLLYITEVAISKQALFFL
jgi:uncharacterized membrane protein SirB2